MVTGRILFLATALAFAAAAVAAPSSKKTASPDAKAQQLVESCDAHKFETVVHEVVDGVPHQSKVKLCGKQGQSDADWILTLEDAVAKLKANKDMSAALSEQIITALNAEVERLQTPVPLIAKPSAGKSTALGGLAPLPGLPQAKSAEASSLPAPRRVVTEAANDDYAALPPLPTAPPAPTRVLTGPAGSVVMLPAPRMTLSCVDVGLPAGPCTGFTRDTVVIVHADENLPAGTSLRFVRDGEGRADVDLPQLKRGASVQVPVPGDVCRHVVGGRFELRIVRSGQEVRTEGPYNLSC